MRTIGHGIDLVHIPRIAATLDRHGDRFRTRCFTPGEIAYARGRRREAQHLAVRFAAKEAVMKAMGAGSDSIRWRDVEVVSRPDGSPALRLSGHAATLAGLKRISNWTVSLTHAGDYASASVIAEGAGAT